MRVIQHCCIFNAQNRYEMKEQNMALHVMDEANHCLGCKSEEHTSELQSQ